MTTVDVDRQQSLVLLTHTSRDWDWQECRREYLHQRYSQPGRFDNLPPFEALHRNRSYRLYSGALSVLELTIDRQRVSLTARRRIESRYKIQHACMVGGKLVLCFEDFLYLLPDLWHPLPANTSLDRGNPCRIDDPWFAGLHTVFPVDENICVVSAAGPDAVLWVDIAAQKVVRRWRLPADIYGVNYDLKPEMSVQDHYIHNDIQLGHLNCAFPDGDGGCLISTLGQGDIGRVGADGAYSLLSRDHVGCHGVRYSLDRRHIYFADSCGGRVMQLDSRGNATEMIRVDSRWLHDIEQLTDDVYLFCLGDRNELSVIDVSRGVELGRFGFRGWGVNVQFVSVVRNGQGVG